MSKGCPAVNNEQAEEKRGVSKGPRGVLDFSSGSEEDEDEQGLKRKATSPGVIDGNRGGNSATGPGRMSLLQHGFSRLLQRVKGKPELAEGDSSPDVDESPSEEDSEDPKMESTSSGICQDSNARNGAIAPHKLGLKRWENSSGSDGEDGENGDKGRQARNPLLKQSDDDAVRKGPAPNGWTNKKTRVPEESDENSPFDRKKLKKLKTRVPRVRRFDGHSDESEDLDMEAKTWPKTDAFNSSGTVGYGGRDGLERNRKRQTANVRDDVRSKFTEDIETYSSSEDEHTPVKKGRSARGRFASPLTDGSRVESTKDERRDPTSNRTEREAGTHKAVSFTHLKSQASPASKGRNGTIDSVLGEKSFYQFIFI